MVTPTTAAALPAPHPSLITPALRKVRGKRLRDTARRDAHAAWEAPAANGAFPASVFREVIARAAAMEAAGQTFHSTASAQTTADL